ncbi:MAG TPA: HAD family hydrolase [Jatrophihabitans sp.]|nr:HAD family hydrolase [Jatrophihabitans sp.]
MNAASRPLVASDLDRTLIYSRGALAAFGDDGAPLVAVERRAGEDASWMLAGAAAEFAELHRHAVVVPVTTRTPEQWRRIRLPGPAPRYAVAANGGVLLIDGVPDPAWGRVVAAALARAAPLGEIWAQMGRVCRPNWTSKLRNASGLFCYAVLHRGQLPEGFLAEASAWAESRGWRLSLQGRKLYWVPRTLTKSAAVAEVARRCAASTVFAAGDSLLDADLLEHADAGILARHGELAASGWRAGHVRVTACEGARAGAEIVSWFRANVTMQQRTQ